MVPDWRSAPIFLSSYHRMNINFIRLYIIRWYVKAFTRHPPSEMICDNCNKSFIRPRWRMIERSSEYVFCSRKCNMEFRKGIPRDPSISRKAVETRRARKSYSPRVVVKCKNCNRKFETVQSKIDSGKGLYCSKSCMGEYFKANYRGSNCKTGLWKGGRSFGKYCFKFNRVLKNNVSNHFGNKCVLCEKPQSENKMKSGRAYKLCIHHVYTEKMACCESKISEMESIRDRLPAAVAKRNESEFSEEEIMYIRMMVPLCKKCHGKMLAEEQNDTPYDRSIYRKFFTDLIISKYGGHCYD